MFWLSLGTLLRPMFWPHCRRRGHGQEGFKSREIM